MLKGKHSIPSNSKIKKEQYLIILAQLRFMLVLVFHTFQPITWCGKFSLFPSERLAFPAYVGLMWIENLALHIADKATKAWEIFSPVQKIIQIHCRWFTLSSVLFSYNYADMYHILMLLTILMKTLRFFKNSGRYPEPFFPESSYEKFTWCTDLTAVLVGNHIC